MKTTKGYLIVLSSAVDAWIDFGANINNLLNKKYRGVARTPSYRLANHGPHPDYYYIELEAVDDYVFNERYKDYETNVIKDFNIALELYKKFLLSPRKFGIIYIESIENYDDSFPEKFNNMLFFGYDFIQEDSDFSYTILSDFPKDETLIKEFFSKLNSYGLFSDYKIACDYLKRYNELDIEKCSDEEWFVCKVYGVKV